MFAVRCTRKLLDRGAPRPLVTPVAPTTILGDWYANIVFTRPEYLVVCISEKTLLPVIVTAKNVKHLPERVAAAVGNMLTAIGVPAPEVEAELAQMNGGILAATVNRRVLGSLNEFVFHFEHGAGSYPELSIEDRALKLANMPCGAIEFVFPSKATLAAFAANRVVRAAKSAA